MDRILCLAASANVRFMEVYRNFIIDGGADPLVFRELVLTLARQVRAANLHIHHHLHLLTQKH